jgi:hypothetical protein
VLALRELENLSYDEIAEIMDMNRNSVAQLISRARIGLRDALRGTALASIAASSADCERAISLLAARQDRQKSSDGDWLASHLLDCCRLSRQAMEEAGVSYRAWLPIAAGPLLFRETRAEAAEAAGADWGDAIARHEAAAAGRRRGGRGRRHRSTRLGVSQPPAPHRPDRAARAAAHRRRLRRRDRRRPAGGRSDARGRRPARRPVRQGGRADAEEDEGGEAEEERRRGNPGRRARYLRAVDR